MEPQFEMIYALFADGSPEVSIVAGVERTVKQEPGALPVEGILFDFANAMYGFGRVYYGRFGAFGPDGSFRYEVHKSDGSVEGFLFRPLTIELWRQIPGMVEGNPQLAATIRTTEALQAFYLDHSLSEEAIIANRKRAGARAAAAQVPSGTA